MTRLNDPHTAPVAVAVRRGVWMRCAPREPGWYWYRSEHSKPEVVYKFDGDEYQTMGTDEASDTKFMLLDNGEFWSLPVEPPPEKRG